MSGLEVSKKRIGQIPRSPSPVTSYDGDLEPPGFRLSLSLPGERKPTEAVA